MNSNQEKTSRSFLEPFDIAVYLSLFVMLLAMAMTNTSLPDLLGIWSVGLWGLLKFMTQVALILMGGYIVADSPVIRSWIPKLTAPFLGGGRTYLGAFLVSSLACWMNWGFGLIFSSFFVVELARQNQRVNYPLLVASTYAGFLFWHGGLSGSIPLVVNSENNFSMQWTQRLIPWSETLFSFFNLSLIFCLLLTLALIILFFQSKPHKNFQIAVAEEPSVPGSVTSSRAWVILFGMIVVGAFFMFKKGVASLGLNEMNFLLIGFGLLVHRNTSSYQSSAAKGCQQLAPIFIQYPLYGGIMAIMVKTGLAEQFSQFFVDVGGADYLPLASFWSAGVVNIFVPSGGGQWVVQAPIVLQAAQQLEVPFWKVILAVSWGDAWTNLIQPFWALPLLSIAGMRLGAILPYCLGFLCVSGCVLSLFFAFI